MGLKWPKMTQNGSKWAKMGLKWVNDQNGSKMAQKWPHRAILGVLGAFSGHLGLLYVILDQYAAAGTSHARNCAS